MMRSRAGFTLVEMMVSITVGLFVVAAAVAVTTDQSRIMGRTTSKLEMHQSARLATDLLAQDLRHAGVGLGYRPDGSFPGLARGSFSVPGGATFIANDRELQLASGMMVTDDVAIRHAVGSMRTIAAFSDSAGQICAGSGLEAGEVVVLMTRAGMHARTVQLTQVAGAPCTDGTCVQGCDGFTFTADSTYVSDAEALTTTYAEGEMAGQFNQVVWFVVPDRDGFGQLQRAEITSATPCQAADASCGGTVATHVESLQVAVWEWDAVTAAWVDRTTSGDITDRGRLRVDIEMVVRAPHVDSRNGAQAPIKLELASGRCLPAPCGTSKDQVPRYAVRSSVEIRNSGRMQIR